MELSKINLILILITMVLTMYLLFRPSNNNGDKTTNITDAVKINTEYHIIYDNNGGTFKITK